MKTVLTIIIPTYNIEDYIGRCIDSFLKVDSKYYSLFELIVVNDGSKDSSAKIVEKYIEENQDLNLKLITKENGGHGSTVNKGIEEAKGKYFKVIDGDDWIKKEAFEILLNKLQSIDVDMVITDFTEQYVYDNKEKHIKILQEEQEMVINGIPHKRIPMHGITYKTSILKNNNIRLSEGIFYVDMQYTLFPLVHITNYMYLSLNVYQYFLGRSEQSMNINSMMKNAMHHYKVTESILLFYNEQKDSRLRMLLKETLYYLISMQFVISYMKQDNLVVQLVRLLNEKNFKYIFDFKTKTAYLIYFNEKTKKIFDYVIKKIVDKQLKKRFNM